MVTIMYVDVHVVKLSNILIKREKVIFDPFFLPQHSETRGSKKPSS